MAERYGVHPRTVRRVTAKQCAPKSRPVDAPLPAYRVYQRLNGPRQMGLPILTCCNTSTP